MDFLARLTFTERAVKQGVVKDNIFQAAGPPPQAQALGCSGRQIFLFPSFAACLLVSLCLCQDRSITFLLQ